MLYPDLNGIENNLNSIENNINEQLYNMQLGLSAMEHNLDQQLTNFELGMARIDHSLDQQVRNVTVDINVKTNSLNEQYHDAQSSFAELRNQMNAQFVDVQLNNTRPNPPIQQTAVNNTKTINFTSSVKDPDYVSVVQNNLNEFVAVVAKYGITLSLVVDDVVVVQLSQSADSCDWRQAFVDMETLVASKEKSSKELNKSKSFLTLKTPPVLKKFYEDIKEEVRIMEATQTATARSVFINQSDMSVLKKSDKLVSKISDKMAEYGDDPLQVLQLKSQRCTAVIDFMKFLQQPISSTSQNGSATRNAILGYFYKHFMDFYFKPNVSTLVDISTINKNKFNVDNVAGTVHFLKIKEEGIKNHTYLALAVIAWKVVACSRADCKQLALKHLFMNLKNDVEFDKSYKLAVDRFYEDRYSDIFVSCHEKGVYEQNKLVVTWIEKNMKFVQFPQLVNIPIGPIFNFFSVYVADV